MIGIFFIIIWLLSNRVENILLNVDKDGYKYIHKWCYWFQFCLFAVAILLTPEYSVNDAIFFLIVYVLLKAIIDRIKVVDKIILRYIKK